MKRISALLILFIVFALTGKTAVNAFCPEILSISSAACDWAEETSEEDESEEDDKALHPAPFIAVPANAPTLLAVHPASSLKSMTREIIAPPPQA